MKDKVSWDGKEKEKRRSLRNWQLSGVWEKDRIEMLALRWSV
jgi:hypothetical protein